MKSKQWIKNSQKQLFGITYLAITSSICQIPVFASRGDFKTIGIASFFRWLSQRLR